MAKPSKSYAHRYLFASALSENESTISNVDFSDDIIATLNCIHAYGKKHFRDFENHKVTFSKECVENFDPTFDCKDSGTTLRMFFPIAIEKYDKATFIGSERLIERGIDIYKNLFKYVTFNQDRYSIKTKGLLSGTEFSLPGNISSQYISGLLYTLPLLENDSIINITTNLESKNYVLMTLDVLSKYGIKILYKQSNCRGEHCEPSDRIGELCEPELNKFIIPGNQKYTASDYSIEGDFSNIAFIDDHSFS